MRIIVFLIALFLPLAACDDEPTGPEVGPPEIFQGSWELTRVVTASTCDHVGRTEPLYLTLRQEEANLTGNHAYGAIAGTVTENTVDLELPLESLSLSLVLSEDGLSVTGTGAIRSTGSRGDCVDTVRVEGDKVTTCESVASDLWTLRFLADGTGTFVAEIGGELDFEFCGLRTEGGRLDGILSGDEWRGMAQSVGGFDRAFFAGDFVGEPSESFTGTWEASGSTATGSILGIRGDFRPTTPEKLLAEFAMTLSQKRFEDYADLLADEFEFYPLAEDLIDFPWLTEDSWGRSIELAMASNLMDENFDGEELPVQSIDVSYQVLSQTDLGDGTLELIANFVFTVLVGPDTGWTADTRLAMVIAPDPVIPAVWQVLTQREVPRLQPFAEETSWAQIKGLYR